MGKENLLEFGKDLGVLDYESSIKIDDLNSLRNQVVWLCLIRNSVLFVFGRLVIVDFSNSSGIQWTSFSLKMSKYLGYSIALQTFENCKSVSSSNNNYHTK